MSIDKTDIWHLFNVAWEKYARPTQELCLDLAEGEVDEKTLSRRLNSIQRSPEIDTSKAFYYFGKAFEKIGLLQGELSLVRANLLYYSVAIADEFQRELEEAIDPPNFERIRAIASKHSEDFAPLKFAGLKREVDLACELLCAEQSGNGGETPSPQAAGPVLATDEPLKVAVPLIRKGPSSAVIEWNNREYQGDLPTAEAIEAMIAAKGQPIGLGQYVRKPGLWLEKLQQTCPQLAAIVTRADGNRGFRVTLFDQSPTGV